MAPVFQKKPGIFLRGAKCTFSLEQTPWGAVTCHAFGVKAATGRRYSKNLPDDSKQAQPLEDNLFRLGHP
jgi:hypothetical protein